MRRVRIAVLVALGLALLALGPRTALAQDQGTTPPANAEDPRIQSNPLLAELARKAPDKLPRFLRELDQVTAASGGGTRSLAPGTPPSAAVPGRVQPTPDEAAAIRVNPDIAYAYQVNPDPMLELLRRMIEAAKKAK